MKNLFHTIMIGFAMAGGWLALLSASARCDDSHLSGMKREYWVDAQVFSMSSDLNPDSFRSHSGGGVSPRGRLGLGVSYRDRSFTASIDGSKKEGRFLIQLKVTPDEKDRGTTAMEKVIDLTDLKPVTFDLARDEDDRVYRLNLFPRITEEPLPKPFQASDLALEKWTFQGSTVIVNDQDYLGQMNMGASPIAFIDVPGLAKVEFSLLRLSDAEPSGALQDGTLRIKHENQHVRITNVRNGIPPETLRGGPYTVWVRWTEPSQTVEQYREAQKEQLAKLKAQIGTEDSELSLETIERIERLVESGRVLQLSSGIRGARKGDIEPSPIMARSER